MPVTTVSVVPAPSSSFISSSMIKEVVSLNGKVEGLVPDNILREIKKKNLGGLNL